MKLRKFIPVLIIAAGIWAYHNSFQGPFIFDDVHSISENSHIRRLWPIREAMSAPYCTVSGRPVVCLALALNYGLGGLNVWGYHAFNLTVHLLSALVLFGILRRTFESEKVRARFGTVAVWVAAAIALIWEVHPLQTECVDYIVQRTELLMGLFLLLTVYCTLRGSQSLLPSAWYLAAVVSCALGMGSKEVMVGAPLIVLLYGRVFLASSFRQQWRQRWGLYIGLASTWLVLPRLVADTHYQVVGLGRGISSWHYLETQAGVVLYYLRLCFWPQPQVIDYNDWPVANSLGDVCTSAVVVVALLGGTVWAFRRHPGLAFLGAWFFLILAPTSSFLPIVGEVAAERRMYLPLAAVVTMAVVGAVALGKRLFNKQQGVVLGCVAGGVVVVLLGSLTIQRNRDYNSALTIWRDTVEKRPNNPRAHDNLGLTLAIAGRLDDAVVQYQEALRIKPDFAEAHNSLGNALVRLGRVQEAIGHYEQALRIKPDFADAHNNLGNALAQLGKLQEAIGQYQQALRIKPDSAEPHDNLGLALFRKGKVQEAIGQYEQALQIQPDFAKAHLDLAIALEQAGNAREAIEHYEQMLRLKPDGVGAQNNLAWLLATLGPDDGANPVQGLALAQHVCELTGNREAPYLDTLAAAYAATGQFSNAVATAEKAIDLARAAGQSQVVKEIEPRLELYRSGRAYRQSVGVTSPRNP